MCWSVCVFRCKCVHPSHTCRLPGYFRQENSLVGYTVPEIAFSTAAGLLLLSFGSRQSSMFFFLSFFMFIQIQALWKHSKNLSLIWSYSVMAIYKQYNHLLGFWASSMGVDQRFSTGGSSVKVLHVVHDHTLSKGGKCRFIYSQPLVEKQCTKWPGDLWWLVNVVSYWEVGGQDISTEIKELDGISRGEGVPDWLDK